MSIAEWFLLVWALGATFMAVMYQHRCRRARHVSFMAHMMLVGLAKGTANMTHQGNVAVFINSDEEYESEIRIETRQG
jgi:hypothetical protein